MSDALIDDAVTLADSGDARKLLGLAGAPAAGKSTLARRLVDGVNRRLGPYTAAYVPLDGFHLSNARLERLGLRHRKGAPETFDVFGYLSLLRRLLSETEYPVHAPDFDRIVDEPVAASLVVPPRTRLVVTEGNYLADDAPGWREVGELLDELWFVEAADSVREERLRERHTTGGMTEESALAFIEASERPNAERVKRQRARCTRVVRV
ncbi:nucleoside/nucleotide kinase family protein [Wenjunlia tyrosinilytica]|uniref:Nucleoside/nucleotide kinase family protein n=1 Tax=Wenjunlia tyrosinilytica TaxID=1544741 RepID=A0A918DRW9_9ACTN|nr:nucleoside/nucleotide kinase family protein [Wenjunlia tyrosinilytica]GGO80458.1 nucleoside/nucleotide kinase family protein [Wenjunlia tyrosinilytica]